MLLDLIDKSTTITAIVICMDLGLYTLYLLGYITIVLCGQSRSNQTLQAKVIRILMVNKRSLRHNRCMHGTNVSIELFGNFMIKVTVRKQLSLC